MKLYLTQKILPAGDQITKKWGSNLGGAMDSMDLDAAHCTGHGHHDEAAVQKAITHLWCQKNSSTHHRSNVTLVFTFR